MKKVIPAIILGLLTGWIVSLMLPPSEGQSDQKIHTVRTERNRSIFARIGPRPPRVDTALTLDEQRLRVRRNRSFSPYRDRLFSEDLIYALSAEELVEAFRNGEIKDEMEIAATFAQIAQSDPILALTLLSEIPGQSHQTRTESALIKTWTKTDPTGFLSHLQELPRGSRRANLARKFALAWAENEPEIALTHLLKLEKLASPFNQQLSESMLIAWAAKNYEAAEQWILKDAPSNRRDAFHNSLLVGHMNTLQRSEAIDFILARPDNTSLQHKLPEVFRNWATHDSERAVKRLATMPADHKIWQEAESLGQRAMMGLLLSRKQVDRSIVLNWAESIPKGSTRRKFLAGAAQNAAGNDDFTIAEKIMAHIPESRERMDAFSTFVEFKMRHDPATLANWLDEQSPSPSRDRAISRFVALLTDSDPTTAQEWAETIHDEKIRKRMLEQLLTQ